MMFDKFDNDGRQIIWDATSLELLLTCPYKYFLLKKRNFWREDPNLDQKKIWGKLYHKYLERFYKSIFNGNSTDESLNNALLEAWKNKNELEGIDKTIKWDNSRTFDTLVRSIIWYTDKWKDNLIPTITLPNGRAAIEERFEFQIPNTNYRCSGLIDRIAYNEDGELICVDYKSTGNTLSSNFFNGFRPNVQVYTYLYFLRIVLGLNVKDFMIDAIQLLVSGTRFERATINPCDSEIIRFMEEQVPYYLKGYDEFMDTGVWPQRFTSCNIYGKCSLRDKICVYPRETHEDKLRAEGYQEREHAKSSKKVIKS